MKTRFTMFKPPPSYLRREALESSIKMERTSPEMGSAGTTCVSTGLSWHLKIQNDYASTDNKM